MIGILPAAGKATRFNGIPKFLLPTPFGSLIDIHCQRMMAAGATTIAIGSSIANMDLVRQHAPEGAPVFSGGDTLSETVLNARQFTENQDVLFGMPDTYWTDESVYNRLQDALDDGAMVSVALFSVESWQTAKLGMCEYVFDYEDNLIVTHIEDKPQQTIATRAWGAIAWKPEFWRFIEPNDQTVGVALQRAIEAGVKPRAYLAYGKYYDCGTADEYFALIRDLSPETILLLRTGRELTEAAHATA